MHSSLAKMKEKKLEGVVGLFKNPGLLISATKKLRMSQYKNFDAFTPYPVHGLDEAQGLKRSPLPFITFAAGLMGAIFGYVLQYWTSVVDWAIIVGGKPFNSVPAFIPIMFECTILFAGLATVFGMFFLNALPQVKKKIFHSGITRDCFALFIEGSLNEELEVQTFLTQLGAYEVKSVYNEEWV